MTSQSLHGSLSFKAGSLALAICAAFAFAAPSLHAQTFNDTQIQTAQSAIQAALLGLPGAKTTITINNATAAQLAEAVAISSTATTIDPAQLAYSAEAPYPIEGASPKIRADRNTSAAIVTGSAINQIIATGTDTPTQFATAAGQIESDMLTIADQNSKPELTSAGMNAVVETDISTVALAYVTGENSSTYPTGDLIQTEMSLGETNGQAEVSLELAKLASMTNPTLSKTKAATINVLNASSTQLAQAVNYWLGTTAGNTSPTTEGALAASVFLPFPPLTSGSSVRSDRNTSSVLVTGSAVAELLQLGNVSNFAADVGAITDDIATVNTGNSKTNLSTAAQTNVINTAIGEIGKAYVVGNSGYSNSTLLTADEDIGESVAQASVSLELAALAATANSNIAKTKVLTINVLNATPTQLAQAVQYYLSNNANNPNSLTADQLVVSEFQPFPPITSGSAVRTDRDSSAPLVTGSAIAELIATSDSSFVPDTATLVDDVTAVNGANSKTNLSSAGQDAVVKTALGLISDSANPATVPPVNTNLSQDTLLSADTQIGAKLTNDAYLESVPKSALLGILETGIEGDAGVKGKATTIAPQAAADFVAGIVGTGVIPDSAFNSGNVTLTTFSQDILKNVSANTSVDEMVANAIGGEVLTQFNAADTGGAYYNASLDNGLYGIASALYAKYGSTAQVTKITQGLVAVVPTSSMENSRVTFLDTTASNEVTAKQTSKLVPILEGAVYTDPYFAATSSGSDGFVDGVFTAIYNSSTAVGSKNPLSGAAGTAATGIGQILGADGDALTNVAAAYQTFLKTGQLPVGNATAYALDLINGAVKGLGTAPLVGTLNATPVGIGGTLFLGSKTITTVSSANVTDLEAIEDLFAEGIVNGDTLADGGPPTSTTKDLSTLASQLGGLAESIAKITGSYTIGTTSGQLVADYLAGSLASYVASLYGATTPVGLAILNTINKDVDAAARNIGTEAGGVNTVFNSSDANYFGTDPNYDTPYTTGIDSAETPITNL